MTYSREQLINRALGNLSVVGAGQTASAEDFATVDGMLNSVMSDLAQRDIYTWGDPDTIDDGAFLHLAEVVADAAANDFGQPKDKDKRLTAEARLRGLQPTIYSGAPQTTEYF